MYKFSSVSNNNSKLLKHVEFYFNNLIQPLYGDQTSALKKISTSVDRRCWLLMEGNKDAGLLVHKTKLNNEHKLMNTFEIKTLFVVNPKVNSGKHIATRLLHKACKEALKLRAKSIFVTASSERPEVIKFFLKNGFEVKNKFHNIYKNGSDEYLLVHFFPLQLLVQLALKLFLHSGKRPPLPTSYPAPSLLRSSHQSE